MRIVITGGSGRIGRVVVQHAADAGHDVLNLDQRHPRPDAPGRYAYAELERRDVLEARLVDFAPDACCHLAEIPDAYKRNEEQVYALNAAATGTLFQTLAEIGVKRVAYASTAQVYSTFGKMPSPTDAHPPVPVPVRLPLDEREPTRPNNGYGAQKVGAEAFLAALAPRYGMTACALRIPGCNDYRNSDWLHWAFSESGRRGKRHGGVRELNAWLDSHDCASAFLACVAWEGEPPWSGFEAFNVAGDTIWHRPGSPSVRELLAEHHPDYPPLPDDFPDDASLYSSEKLRRATGWRPAVTMAELWQAAEIETRQETP